MKTIAVISPNALGDSLYCLYLSVHLTHAGFHVNLVSTPLSLLYPDPLDESITIHSFTLANINEQMQDNDHVLAFSDGNMFDGKFFRINTLLSDSELHRFVVCNLTTQKNHHDPRLYYQPDKAHPFADCHLKGFREVGKHRLIVRNIDQHMAKISGYRRNHLSHLPGPLLHKPKLNIDPKKTLLIFHTITSDRRVSKRKMWPMPFWFELAQHMENQGCQIIWNMSPNDLKDNPLFNAQIFSGSLNELAYLYTQAALHVGVDSGPGYLASLMNCESLTLSFTDTYSRGYHPCLATRANASVIQPPIILRGLKSILKKIKMADGISLYNHSLKSHHVAKQIACLLSNNRLSALT